MIAAVLDHLWQSTLILGVVALLSRLLHRNGAQVRYRLWFAASLKFLAPFPLLAAGLARLTPLSSPSLLSAPTSRLAERMSVPLALEAPVSHVVSAPATPAPVPYAAEALLAIWALGCAAVLISWLIRWWRVRQLLLSSRPLSLAAPIPVRLAPTSIEPGLVGIWRPVLLLPQGLTERLSPKQLHTIFAHELCHLRRRDNLTSALHMLAEALFWFYPPVWWLGARLIAEREQACDEAVLADGNDAQAYAEGILTVCRFFTTSPLECQAGVAGGDLRARVERIMSGGRKPPVDPLRKLCVAISLVGTIAAPLFFEACVTVPPASPTVARLHGPERATLLYEQTRPQHEVPFHPADFDQLVGAYQSDESRLYTVVYRRGNRYFAHVYGARPVEFFPEGPRKFFATALPIQISFVSARDGRITGLVIHQNGQLAPAHKVSTAHFEAAVARIRRRIERERPSPGTRAALIRWIDSVDAGHPDYAEMSAARATATHARASLIARHLGELGSLQSMTFLRVNRLGFDVYAGTFAHGHAEFFIAPLADGKVVWLRWRAVP